MQVFRRGIGRVTATAIASQAVTTSLAGDLAHTGTKVGLNGNTPVVKAAAVTAPTAPSVVYAQAEAASAVAAINAIRVALANVGITA